MIKTTLKYTSTNKIYA